MGLIAEFKAFALRGNVVDMAVGIVIGAAFGKIIASLVSDIILPPIGAVIGGIDFTSLAIDLPGKMKDPADATKMIPVKLKYGAFLQALFDFTIVAFALFAVIKGMNALKKKEAAAPPPPPTETEKLLAEIRDSLKAKG